MNDSDGKKPAQCWMRCDPAARRQFIEDIREAHPELFAAVERQAE